MKVWLCGLVVLGAWRVGATGFEKTVLWSAESAGRANAVVSETAGAEALSFNPAGLALTEGQELSFNLTGSVIQFSGPITAANDQLYSKWTFLPPFGLLYAKRLGERLGVGAGVYAVAGSTSDYGEVDFSGLTGLTGFKPLFKGHVQIFEASLGAGYKIARDLYVGASWRVTFTKAELNLAGVDTTTGVSLIEQNLTGLSDTDFGAFRFGVQYQPGREAGENRWGVGLMVRTKVSFAAEGDGAGRFENSLAPGTVINLSSTGVTVRNALPLQLALGGHYRLGTDWKLMGGYEFTNYSDNKAIEIDGTLTGAAAPITLSDIAQNWQDFHLVRVAAEWKESEKWPLRFGYIYGSAVAQKANAVAVLVAPGPVHTLTLGTGTHWLDGRLKLDLAADWGFIKTSVEAGDIPAGSTTLAGDYSSEAIDVHTTLRYLF